MRCVPLLRVLHRVIERRAGVADVGRGQRQPLVLQVVADVAPALVDLADDVLGRDPTGHFFEELMAEQAPRIPLGRAGLPSEVGSAAVFLASEATPQRPDLDPDR
jgi:hypothetical protein